MMSQPSDERFEPDKPEGLVASDLPFYFTSEMTVKPEHLDEFLTALRAANNRARSQPGCVYLHCHQSVSDPCVVLMIEHWTSYGAFEEQELNTEWMTEYLVRTGPFHAKERIVRLWNSIDC